MLQALNYSEEQHEAIDLGSDSSKKLVGITGAAGTGKTSVMGEILENGPWKMPILVAPTGRAAKRIHEATGHKAKTIHRMMGYGMPDEDDPDQTSLPKYDKWNKFPYDCVLVDEGSMVSEDIYRAVIDAMPPRGVIRFVGDANQLPPVQGKSPFLEILEKWPSVRLTHNFRSTDGIVSAATSIVNNRIPEANDKFHMINPGNGNIFKTIETFIDDSFRGLNGQLIIPTKQGKFGTFYFNSWLQQKLNPTGKTIEIQVNADEKRRLRVGDKVIQTKNDYKLNVFNGEIGWIVDIDDDTLVVNFDDRDVVIPPHLESYDPRSGRAIFQYDPRKNIDLAYAITTHKAQGSEFNKVVLLLQRSYVLNRANFYTAVTRAKDKCTVVLGPGALATAMKR